MRQTPVNDYLEEVSTRLPEELYGNLSDAIYETVCEFDEEVAQLKAENAKLREQLEYALQTSRARLETIDRLKAENAKLRAVIESEIHCWKGSCNGCVAYRPTEDGWCDQQSWLEELGIEGQL